MKTTNKIKFFLLSLLTIAAAFDIYSTIRNMGFLTLETNIGFLVFNGVWILFFGKILTIGFFSYLLFHPYWAHRTTFKFFIIYMIVSLIGIQLLVGMNNMSVQRQVLEDVNYKTGQNYTMQSLPQQEIQQYAQPKKQMANYYLQFIFAELLYPLIIAMSAFIFYQKIGDKN